MWSSIICVGESPREKIKKANNNVKGYYTL